jgi:hypothetical protein
MAQQIINVGASANDQQGDPIRTSFQKTNANFTELFGETMARFWPKACATAASENYSVDMGW